jgi:hypothetical protein
MNFAEARKRLIEPSRRNGVEDHALRAVEERLKASGTYSRKEAVELLCAAAGIPDFLVQEHIGKHRDLETFSRDLQLGHGHHQRAIRALRGLKTKLTEDEVCAIILDYLDLA